MRPWYIGCASGFHPDEASPILAGRSNTNPSLVLGFIFCYTSRMKNLTHEEILKWIVANRDEMSEKWRNHYFIVEERKGHPGFYYAVHHFVTRNFNEARSAMWFGDRELERAYGKKSRASGNWADYANALPYKFSLEHGYHYMMQETQRDLMGVERIYAGVPVVEHDSIYDFYKAIGYDYKKKSFDPDYPYN